MPVPGLQLVLLMGRMLRHLRLVALNGKRVADPPMTEDQRKRAAWREEAKRRNAERKKNR